MAGRMLIALTDVMPRYAPSSSISVAECSGYFSFLLIHDSLRAGLPAQLHHEPHGESG